MSEQDNMQKTPKKIGAISLTKKNVIRLLVILIIIFISIFGINSYLSYKHQVFLDRYNNAIASIENKDKSGYKDAFQILKQLVKDNEATTEDYFYLGYIYQYGLGTKKDYSDAYKYYNKAVKQNYTQAYYQIAILYRDGLGVNKNSKRSIEYFKKAYRLGDKAALKEIAELIRNNSTLISITEPSLLYDIYLAYQSGKLVEFEPDTKNKFLIAATANGYEPALILQARNLLKNGDNYRALMLWQTLLYSSDPKVSELAKKEIPKVEKLVKQQRDKEKQLAKKALEEKKKKQQQKANEEIKRKKQIMYKRNIGLSVPKQKIKNLNGLIYINLFNIDKTDLQNFYKEIADIELESSSINNTNNLNVSYIDDFIKLSKLKHNESSLKIDFGDQANNNKYEGITYYFYNDKDDYTQGLLNSIITNKPKESSLKPRLEIKNDEIINTAPIMKQATTFKEVLKIDNNSKNNDKAQKTKEAEKAIELTHREKMQRMQVFAQKGDFRQFYKLEKIADSGDPYAMYYVGEYYYNDKEYDKAMKYFKKSAAANYGPAYYKLASLYYNEEKNGVPYDKQKAMEYYQKAADLGVRNAKHILMLID